MMDKINMKGLKNPNMFLGNAKTASEVTHKVRLSIEKGIYYE